MVMVTSLGYGLAGAKPQPERRNDSPVTRAAPSWKEVMPQVEKATTSQGRNDRANRRPLMSGAESTFVGLNHLG